MKMSRKSSGGGGSVKRKRQQQLVEEVAPASLQLTVHPEPLMLLAVVKSYHRTLVWAQLCNPQGVFLFSHVCLPPRVPHPFAGAPVYDMLLTHAERLGAVGCGFKGKLVRLLSLGVGRHFEPQRNMRACLKMMQSVAKHVAAGLAAVVRDKIAKEAEELCASGQCVAAVVALQRAIYLGDLPSLALMAWLHIDDSLRCMGTFVGTWPNTFELAEEGARLGCHHCQGVMAYCYIGDPYSSVGFGCRKNEVLSLELARKSSGKGSRYGQFTLGMLHYYGAGGLAEDNTQALAFYRLAAEQGLDSAQFCLGDMHNEGDGVAENEHEAERLYQLAAAQGHGQAMWRLSCMYTGAGRSEKAKFWLRRALEANCFDAICYNFNE